MWSERFSWYVPFDANGCWREEGRKEMRVEEMRVAEIDLAGGVAINEVFEGT